MGDKKAVLTLLTGPAGSGKTYHCLGLHKEYLKSADFLNSRMPQSFYIVPTREHAKRIHDLILRDKDVNVIPSGSVATFRDFLQSELKEHVGDVATDVLKKFFLADILRSARSDYFRDFADSGSFIRLLADFLSEIKAAGVSANGFRSRAKALAKDFPGFKAKYEELAAIYSAYEKRLEEEGLQDYDGIANRILVNARRGQTPSLRCGRIIIDGFYEFTREQYEVIKILLDKADEIIVTLTMDDGPDREGLFAIPAETKRELEGTGFRHKPMKESREGRAASGVLACLERNIFSAKVEKPVPAGGDILIFESTGIRGEMEMAAREILRLYKEDERYRFSDFCIILRRIGDYEHVARSVFGKYKVPVDVHERIWLKTNPLIRTLMSFLAVFHGGWKREDLFRFVKSSYSGIPYDAAAEFELFCIEQGVLSGRAEYFAMVDAKEEDMEYGGGIRKELERLKDFEERFKKEAAAKGLVRLAGEAISGYGLMENEFREERLKPENGGAEEEFRLKADCAAYRRLTRIMEELEYGARSRRGGMMDFSEFYAYLSGAVEGALFSVREKHKDCVQVYDISTARQKEYKVVFICGLLQKGFPAEIREDALLKDAERRVFNGGEPVLKERLPRQALERYLFYLAVTRARDKLILSYPRFDLDGKEALPSFYVDEARRCFSSEINTKSSRISDVIPAAGEAASERELTKAVLAGLWEERGAGDPAGGECRLTLLLYNERAADPAFRALAAGLYAAKPYGINDPDIKNIFSRLDRPFSATALEIYGACPYRYFLEHVVRLNEIEDTISVLDMGTILHKVLEELYRKKYSGKGAFPGIDDAKAFARSVFDKTSEEIPLRGERKFRIDLTKLWMQEIIERLIEKEYKEEPLSGFRPHGFEVAFGDMSGGKTAADKKGLAFEDTNGRPFSLRGKIDRVDVDPGRRFALVIDYKLGKREKAVENIMKGLYLQLPLYILAVREFMKIEAAGGCFYSVSRLRRDGFYNRTALESLGLGHKAGSFPEDEFEELIHTAAEAARKYVSGIRNSQFPVLPRDCGRYCGYDPVCRLGKWEKYVIKKALEDDGAD